MAMELLAQVVEDQNYLDAQRQDVQIFKLRKYAPQEGSAEDRVDRDSAYAIRQRTWAQPVAPRHAQPQRTNTRRSPSTAAADSADVGPSPSRAQGSPPTPAAWVVCPRSSRSAR